ncbi:hypothetical protein KGD83_25080 [Nocardiopsis akebiae]|uniref:Uncharacterized protein n=1 Tax=Nocardiopsis akebiae TaxID=2831968 RepID=A0ABX8C6F4_9ACTN|nr:hypothetical protein KGD83_25080 [Nocardiopsis akebiae]
MPPVLAFLDTCAAAESTDHRYVCTLLGGELADNSIRRDPRIRRCDFGRPRAFPPA